MYQKKGFLEFGVHVAVPCRLFWISGSAFSKLLESDISGLLEVGKNKQKYIQIFGKWYCGFDVNFKNKTEKIFQKFTIKLKFQRKTFNLGQEAKL